MRNRAEDVSPQVLIGAASLSADNTPPAVALAGFNSCTILIAVGIGGITFTGSNKIEFKLTESDNGTDYTAVSDDDVAGATVGTGGIILSLVEEHAAAAVYEFSYVGDAQHLKLLADFSGTHGSGTPIAALAVLGDPVTRPAA